MSFCLTVPTQKNNHNSYEGNFDHGANKVRRWKARL